MTGPEVGIWFGCEFDAGGHAITIGESSNIQDNTIIRCEAAPVRIGRESTVGHNVLLTDCLVGDRSLVGMGAVVAPGTVIEDDVLLAAGSRTTEDQRLESGWLYGGVPARQMSPLDDRKRAIITTTWPTYRAVAATKSWPSASTRGFPASMPGRSACSRLAAWSASSSPWSSRRTGFAGAPS